MITPAPTTRIDPRLARGVLESVAGPGATRPGHIVVAFPNTSYRVELGVTAAPTTPVGKRIVGVLRADAKRVDVVRAGGRFIEPVFGRPRRLQGVIVGVDGDANTITIDAGVPFTCALTDPRRRATAFEPGQLVACDLVDGAAFTPSL